MSLFIGLIFEFFHSTIEAANLKEGIFVKRQAFIRQMIFSPFNPLIYGNKNRGRLEVEGQSN